MNYPGTSIPIEYYLCETRNDVKNWIIFNKYHRNFPVQFINTLVDLEFERLGQIKKLLKDSTDYRTDEYEIK
jgi:hypothetical protein